MNTNLKLSVVALLAIFSIAACSQKPSAEEVAAQVKIEMDKEKAQQSAQNAEVASEVAAQVKVALAEEKAKQVVATPAPAVEAEPVKKAPAPKHETPKAKPVTHETAAVAQPAGSLPVEQPVKHVCDNCGMVLAVNMVEEQGKGSGLGVIGGGLVGGLLGNQVGNGNGRDVATIAGVVGGAIAGNAIEKNAKKTHHYEIAVRMDDGTERTYRQATDPGLASGARVKIENDTVIKN